MTKGSSNPGFYFRCNVWHSEAFQCLNPSARNLLFELLASLRYAKAKKGRGTRKRYVNNGEVGFPYTLYKRRYGASKATYQRARNQLIECGFIKVTHAGGFARGDYAKYRVLLAEDISTDHQRWRRYPSENWENEIPKSGNHKIGLATRFKSGNHPNK
jgi:hypothetical protein